LQGDTDKALKYYTIMAESDDEEFSELAKAEIQKLTCPEKTREIFPVDWKKLKKIVKKDSDAVKEAVNRLSEVESDPSLTYQDRILAFYGQALLTNGREQSLADDASRLFSQKDYVNALGKAKEALEINPLNLTALEKAGAAIVMLIEQGDTSFTSDDAMYYFNVAMRIFNTIAATGYGSEEHPFCITSVADEYVFMRNYLEIYRIKQQALVGVCDVFILEETSQYYSEQKIYFDATLPLERLQDLF
jgi:tetratricopeptide (TPR) repeat protein